MTQQTFRKKTSFCVFRIFLFFIYNFLNDFSNRNKNVEIKQTSFADDASFFTENNNKSFETLVQT